MSETTAIFNALYASLAEARAQVRIDGKTVIARALSSGIGRTRESSEQGLYGAAVDQVRVLLADVPAGKLALGNEIEVAVNGGAWVKLRIAARKDTGGVVTLTVGDLTE